MLTQKQVLSSTVSPGPADRGRGTDAALLSFSCPPLPPGGRSLRCAHEGHHAADVQEEALMVTGCLLQPAEERPGEEV